MLEQAKNIFFLGIKGVAMANLAVLLKKMDKNVTGCDLEEEFITDQLLRENKIGWETGFDLKKLSQPIDLIVYSAAHGGTNNPLIIEAKKRKIALISQAQLLSELTDQFENKIAVCGCHGKTTTSSLLVYALNKLKQKPSYLVGAPFFTDHQGSDFQNKKYFVIEADEYGVNPPSDKTPKFNLLNPNYIIATNIDFDHPDVYKDIKETKEAFKRFFDKKGIKIFTCIDDSNLMEVVKKLSKKNYLTYGFNKGADYKISDWKTEENGSSFTINNFLYKTNLFGEKNVSNVAAVVSFLLHLGFPQEKIAEAIKNFTGAERRFEKVYFKNNIYLFDDYAHHPAEISATINAAKNRFKGRRILVIFQPHTFSRTAFLVKEFAESLSLADISFVLPIFSSARENQKEFKISSKEIINEGKMNNLFLAETNEQLINELKKILKSGDVVFTMGAGNVYKLKKQIIEIINQKSGLKIERNKNLLLYNTLKTNSLAEYFLEARTREDLIEGKKFALENQLSVFILAGGSNLALVKDKIKGLVIKNNYLKSEVINETDDDVHLLVSSGYPVSKLVAETTEKGYEGFEYHKGLPGTVGGAIYMNSKWTKPVNYFGDNLIYAYLLDGEGKNKKVTKDYFQFQYDYSILQKTKDTVLEAVFQLKKADPAVLKKRADFAFEYRKKTQPMGVKTSGCFFRNVNGQSAGQLIDQAGLKNFSVGDFFVSPIHANFIINRGHGQTKDLLKLVKIIKEKVKEKFKIELKEEVIVI
jgi:UDP-N-acetylmuramate--L-alanine ligase/UDP-N-acetylenolpyruvoylglucosamine reductase